MKFGVVVFPGSNCDDDMFHVLGTVMGAEVRRIWHKDTRISEFGTEDCLILPGGFSYGDYLRAGAIARFAPVMKSVTKFASQGGIVWGICNGFQILCEAGLLPGVLLRNENEKFICKNVHLRVISKNSILTRELSKSQVLKIPIAHADGRYYADQQTLDSLESNDQILFKYCGESGELQDNWNINGSSRNIAGICDKNRRVFGMMPHPERAAEDILGNTDGLYLFQSLLTKHTSLV